MWGFGLFQTPTTKYGHKNIVKAVSDWEDKNGCRDFKTVEQMNSVLVDNINKYVKPEDTLFCLGDWSFGGIDSINKFRFRLNVRDIHLVLGNHDDHIRKNKFLGYVRDIPLYTKDIFSSTNDYLEISIDKKKIILSHYPMLAWNHAYRGSWHLYGHTHGTLFKYQQNVDWFHKSRMLDVGMDSAFDIFGEYKPFSFDDVKRIMEKKDFVSIDHHNKKTKG